MAAQSRPARLKLHRDARKGSHCQCAHGAGRMSLVSALPLTW